MCPLSVKFVALISIVIAIAGAIPMVIVLLDPAVYEALQEFSDAYSSNAFVSIPLSFQIAQSIGGVFVVLLSCFYMLKGRRWALFIYTFWIVSSLLFSLLVTGSFGYILYKIPVTIIILTILYTGKSKSYFFTKSKSGG